MIEDERGIQVNQVIILFCKQVIISQSINQSSKQAIKNNQQPKLSGRSVEHVRFGGIKSGQSKQIEANRSKQ
eukprot:scaffold29294_cov81-Skeletonema_marinoi.AAC.1